MKISKTTSLTTKVSILSISCALIGGTSAYAGKLPADVPEYPSYPRIMVLGKAKASKEVEKAKQEAQKKKEEDAQKAKEAEDAAKAAQQKKIEADKLAEQARKEIEAEKKRLEAKMRKEEQNRKAAEAAKAIAAEEARVAAQVEKARQELEARKRDEAIKAAEAEKARLAEEARRLAAAEAEKARLAAEKKKAQDARVAEAERLEAEARRAVSRDPVRKKANTVRSSTVVKKAPVAKRSSTYRKRSGISTVSKGSTNQAKQVALHDHYAKWVSSYVGGHIGRSSTADQGGVEVGVFGGRNWKSDKIVYGIEGGVSKSNSSGSFAQNGSYDAGWSATVRVRGGYLVRPDTLLYATAGVAWTNFDINAGGREVSDTYAGFVIGAGLEHQFNDNWSARAEYTYTDYGSTTYQHNGQAYTFDPETHAFRVAVVYKF